VGSRYLSLTEPVISGFVITAARGQLRRQLAAYVSLGALVALGGGAALGAAIASHRTDRAYSDFVEQSEVAELVINPSLSSVAMTDAIKGLDGVEAVYSSSLLAVLIGNIESGVFGELGDESEPWLQVLGSVDGRFVEVDRPLVTSGRLPTGDHELFVNEEERPFLEAAVGHQLAVGDTVQLSFFWSGLFLGNVDLSETVSSIGVETLRISGFGVLPDEVLPDELYPRQRLIVSGDIAHKYTCASDFRANMTDEEAMAAAFPLDCAVQYEYFSLQLDGEPGTAASIRQQFGDAAELLAQELPPFIQEQGAGYYYISQDRADVDAAVARAIRPTVAALNLFAIVTMLATVAIFGVAVSRVARQAETESRRLMELGATKAQRVVGAILPALVAGRLARDWRTDLVGACDCRALRCRANCDGDRCGTCDDSTECARELSTFAKGHAVGPRCFGIGPAIIEYRHQCCARSLAAGNRGSDRWLRGRGRVCRRGIDS